METRPTVKFLVVIAHYNHETTLRQVVEQCLAVTQDVLVVDDGSTQNPQPLLNGLPVHFLRQTPNQGKGTALLAGARFARENHFTHIITLDADAQHNPAEIPTMIAASKKNPHALIIGVRKFDQTVPISSRFGRKFGGFWVHLQTGQKIHDVQSGYRCYPVELLKAVSVWSKRYAFEVEIIVRALWAGFKVCETEVSVVYTKERISHFNKLKDNFRLTVLNTYLIFRSMLPIAHRKYVLENGKIVRQNYKNTLRQNLTTPGSVLRNALSAAWGIFCGTIALIGIRQIFLFAGAGWWNLNRLVCVSFEKLCVGPIVPALCIEMGYFLRHGHFLSEFNLTTLGRQAGQRIWEWLLGSLVLAPCLAVGIFIITFIIGYVLRRNLYEHG